MGKKKSEAQELDQDFEDFVHKAQLYWVNIRGDRYVNHDVAHLTDVLSPHDDILRELFGVGAADVIAAYEALQNALIRGVFESLGSIRDIQQETWPTVRKQLKGTETEEEVRDMVQAEIDRLGLRGKSNKALEDAFGYGLFDVARVTGLPAPLLAELSYKPGEESSFFAPGQFRGWPLRVWPNWIRPFISLEGKIYCFDLYSIKDRIYRTLQRLICRLRPQYQETWNQRQKTMSEELPLRLFRRLLPNCTTYQSLHYRFRANDQEEEKWFECDGVVIFDDVLLVVEVKAGAFALAPPSTNFDAYIASLKALVVRPAEQSVRFLKYLRSAPEVSLFDGGHREILRLKNARYRTKVPCAVTLDAFTELAARAAHLSKVGVDIGSTPVWNLAIDDLRIYVDLFKEPLRFLHYVEQRVKAVLAPGVDVEDEIDHLGLYLKHNHYVEFANEATGAGASPLHWHGYRQDVDKYYHRLMAAPEEAVLPIQSLPPRMDEILRILNSQSKPGRSWLANSLLDMNEETRQNTSNSINVVMAEQGKLLRVKPFSTHGDVKMTVFCWQPHLFAGDRLLAQEHSRIVMLVNNDVERLILEIQLSETGAIIDVSWGMASLVGLSERYLSELRQKADELRKRRVTRGLSEATIGQNTTCPCGSGRKFKHCCGRQALPRRRSTT